MIWRILGLLFNPIAALLWPLLRWIGRGIDRMLGPVVGWYAALVLLIVAIVSLAAAAFFVLYPVARHIGLLEPIHIQTVPGTVTAAETLSQTRLTIRQRVTVAYEAGGKPVSFVETVTEPVSQPHQVGDTVMVHLQGGRRPTIDNPTDPVVATVVAVLGLLLPLVQLIVAVAWLRHRRRLYDARPKPTEWTPGSPPATVGRVPTTAERLRADEERMRQLGIRK